MPKIAIIIPLLNRHEFTERILGYYNIYKVDYTFYLADGSKNKIFNQKKLRKQFPNIKIIYKSFPFDANYKLYAYKMLKMTKTIKSKYVYQIANDDFFNPLFLKKAEKFLNQNKSYSMVGGIVRNIRIIQLFKPTNDHGKFYSHEKVQYHQYKDVYKDINFNKTENRVIHFESSLPYENVIKSSTYIKIWKLINQFQINDGFEMTWFFNIVPLLDGKKKHLNIISTVRQSNTYKGLGMIEMFSGASKKRFFEFLKFLQYKNIIKSKIIIKKLKNTSDASIDVLDNKSTFGKKNSRKKIYFPVYLIFKETILKINYIFTYIFFYFYRNKYQSIYLKIHTIFNHRKNKL